MVAGGEPAPFWITADEQTQGRGRLERNWVSSPGNLYSTLIGPPPSQGAAALIPFAVSLAVFDAINAHLPEARRAALQLKWPNDVLVEGAKTSGILIERRHVRGQHTTYLPGSLMAIGVGINVAHAPDIPDRATTCLKNEGSGASVGQVFSSLRTALADALQRLETAPQAILPAWMQRAVGIGEAISIDMGSETLQGTFDHLASDGALMLRLPSGAMRAIRTGDIVIKPR